MMPPNVPKKGSKGSKSPTKPRTKKNVQVDAMSDSDESESLLGPERPSQRPVSEHNEVEEGKEASERRGPEVTQEVPGEDGDVLARKRAHVSDGLIIALEQDLVDVFVDHPSSMTRH